MADIIGIDVSEMNGSLDWAKIKAAGVKFAILRAGYGRYAEDSQFQANVRGALAQGIPVGVYWFSYALNTDGAKQEAAKCLETIKGYNVTLPVFFDFEYDTVRYGKDNGVTLGKQAFNDHAVAFCDAVQAAGYKAGVYYNLDYYRNYVDENRLKKFVQWYAQYNTTADISGWAIWQYSSSGTISGCSGRFDMDLLKDESLLSGSGQTDTEGWQKDSKGWWYQNADGSYIKSAWKKISGNWYYFGSDGYMAADAWQSYQGSWYYLGSDGAMVTDKTVRIDGAGKLIPSGDYYTTMGQVPAKYRETLDKLVKQGVLKGRNGTGDNRQIDLSEESVRLLVMLERAGVFA